MELRHYCKLDHCFARVLHHLSPDENVRSCIVFGAVPQATDCDRKTTYTDSSGGNSLIAFDNEGSSALKFRLST